MLFIQPDSTSLERRFGGDLYLSKVYRLNLSSQEVYLISRIKLTLPKTGCVLLNSWEVLFQSEQQASHPLVNLCNPS